MFIVTLILSTFLCSLVAGFLFAYAVVIMPGIKSLDDKDFIRAFQVTDKIIQDNQPLFIFTWVGSAVALLACAFFGFGTLNDAHYYLLLLATLSYLAGVQISTAIINLPLNSQLQQVDTELSSEQELSKAREIFEDRWNRSNTVRTIVASAVSFILLLLVFWN